jgi:putative ABC transport system permease protein
MSFGTRASPSDTSMDHQDFFRIWFRRPAVGLLCVLIIGTGITCTTLALLVAEVLLLRPLPWADSDRIVRIYAVQPDRRSSQPHSETWNRAPFSWGSWQALTKSGAFSNVGVWWRHDQILGLARTNVTETLYASSGLFDVLGLSIATGRNFSEAEDAHPSDVAVLTNLGWHRHFGGRPDVIGKTLYLSMTPDSPMLARRVVGVLAADPTLPMGRPEVILPIGNRAYVGQFENMRFLHALGKLAAGVTPTAALGMSEPLIRGDDAIERRTARIVPLRRDVYGEGALPFSYLVGGCLLLFVMASCTAVGLLVGDGRARRSEIAIRAALGETRGTLLRRVAAEHSSLGVATGILAMTATAVLAPVVSVGLGFNLELKLNSNAGWTAVIVVFLLSLATAVGSGMIAALQFVGTGTAPSQWSARGSGKREAGSRRFLMVAQVSATLVLLICALLFAESLRKLESRSLGFDPAGLVAMHLFITDTPATPPAPADLNRADPSSARLMLDRQALSAWVHAEAVLRDLATVPGVVGVAGVQDAPFVASERPASIRISTISPSSEFQVQRQVVTANYFEVMRIPILDGRVFGGSDREGARTAVVSSQFAKRFMADKAVGRSFSYGGVWYEVVGVAGDVAQSNLRADDRATFYLLNSSIRNVPYLVIRAAGDSQNLLGPINQALAKHSAQFLVTGSTLLEEEVRRSMAYERFRTISSSVFAVLALALSSLGLYSVALRWVIDRRHEIAIRLAVGALPKHIVALVLRDIARSVLVGVAVGVPVAYAVSTSVRLLLFAVSPVTFWVYVVAAMVVIGVSFCATVLPIRTALGLNPRVGLST